MATSEEFTAVFPWISTNVFIIGAPMRILSGPALATAISEAGGLGFLGPGAKTIDTVQDLDEAADRIRFTRSSHKSRLSHLPSTYDLLPIGVGFQLWNDDIVEATGAIGRLKPCSVWLYAPNHASDLETWTIRIRSVSPRTQIWIQIGTVDEVKGLLERSYRPDVLVVQGLEAGGHGHRDAIGLITILPEIADLVEGSGIKIVAAGGIADGRGVSAALCLGATGVAMGTRFLASTEARINQGYQQEVVRATNGGVNTVRTLLYNHLRGTTGWPEPYIPRGILNRTWIEHQGGKSFQELKEHHDEAAVAGEAGWGPEGRLATYAGASIGLVHQVKSAADIIHDIEKFVLRQGIVLDNSRL